MRDIVEKWQSQKEQAFGVLLEAFWEFQQDFGSKQIHHRALVAKLAHSSMGSDLPVAAQEKVEEIVSEVFGEYLLLLERKESRLFGMAETDPDPIPSKRFYQLTASGPDFLSQTQKLAWDLLASDLIGGVVPEEGIEMGDLAVADEIKCFFCRKPLVQKWTDRVVPVARVTFGGIAIDGFFPRQTALYAHDRHMRQELGDVSFLLEKDGEG